MTSPFKDRETWATEMMKKMKCVKREMAFDAQKRTEEKELLVDICSRMETWFGLGLRRGPHRVI